MQKHNLNNGLKNKIAFIMKHIGPPFFQSKAETWRQRMVSASKGSLKGHEAYASYQLGAWEGLSDNSKNALSVITNSPVKTYDVQLLLL